MPRLPAATAVRLRAAAAAGLTVLMLGGCASSDGARAQVMDISAAPRGELRDGGTLRWAVDSMPGTLNTFLPDADEQTARVASAVLPVLFRIDGRGRPQRNADYLESAEVVTSEPRQVVSYRIAPDAEWSDGRAIGAEDFTAQWKALSGRNDAYWPARTSGYDRIAGIEQGAGAREVKVTFARPYADWRLLFTPLYPTAVTATAEAFNDSARTALRVTAGPFTVDALEPGAKTVTLVRDEKWWGDRPKLDRIVLTALPGGARAAALSDGRADVAEIPSSSLPAVERDKTLSVRKAPAAAYTQLALNGSSGPLTDERVRRAVARAIDRRAIAESVLGPLGLPAEGLGNHLLLPTQDGYSDHSSALGGTDDASARDLLVEAGWESGGPRSEAKHAGSGPDAVVRKNGSPLHLGFVVPASSDTYKMIAAAVTRMLAGIGIHAEITEVPGESFLKDHIAAGDFDLALFTRRGSAYPATDAAPFFGKPGPGPAGSSAGVGQNYTRVGSDHTDQLLEQAAGELDPADALELTDRADARIWAAAGSVPLYQSPEIVAAESSVANVGAFGFADPRYQDIGFRK